MAYPHFERQRRVVRLLQGIDAHPIFHRSMQGLGAIIVGPATTVFAPPTAAMTAPEPVMSPSSVVMATQPSAVAAKATIEQTILATPESAAAAQIYMTPEAKVAVAAVKKTPTVEAAIKEALIMAPAAGADPVRASRLAVALRAASGGAVSIAPYRYPSNQQVIPVIPRQESRCPPGTITGRIPGTCYPLHRSAIASGAVNAASNAVYAPQPAPQRWGQQSILHRPAGLRYAETKKPSVVGAALLGAVLAAFL